MIIKNYKEKIKKLFENNKTYIITFDNNGFNYNFNYYNQTDKSYLLVFEQDLNEVEKNLIQQKINYTKKEYILKNNVINKINKYFTIENLKPVNLTEFKKIKDFNIRIIDTNYDLFLGTSKNRFKFTEVELFSINLIFNEILFKTIDYQNISNYAFFKNGIENIETDVLIYYFKHNGVTIHDVTNSFNYYIHNSNKYKDAKLKKEYSQKYGLDYVANFFIQNIELAYFDNIFLKIKKEEKNELFYVLKNKINTYSKDKQEYLNNFFKDYIDINNITFSELKVFSINEKKFLDGLNSKITISQNRLMIFSFLNYLKKVGLDKDLGCEIKPLYSDKDNLIISYSSNKTETEIKKIINFLTSSYIDAINILNKENPQDAIYNNLISGISIDEKKNSQLQKKFHEFIKTAIEKYKIENCLNVHSSIKKLNNNKI